MSERLLFLDFETTSHTDLITEGLARYIAEPTTRAYCLTYRLPGADTTELWAEGAPFPSEVLLHVAEGGAVVAHNAPFDFHIWNTVLSRQIPNLPTLRAAQMRCSAVRARYNGLPGSLEKACEAMGLPVLKDMDGSRFMKEIAANPEWTAESHPEHFGRVYRYAIIDTDAMVGLWDATKPITAQLQKEFMLDMEINARGFGVDVEAAKGMEEMKQLAVAYIDYKVTCLSNAGVMAVSEVAKLKEHVRLLGEEVDDASRESLKALIDSPTVSDDVKEMLSLRLDASRTPKKSAAILRAHVNGRMCHSTLFYGALSGRSTARGCGNVQLLNLARPRPGHKAKAEAYLEAARRGDLAFLSAPDAGPPLAALADAQRLLFCATRPEHVLVVADLSGIEARIAPWLAGDTPKLEDYEAGIDSYKRAAAGIYGVVYEAVTGDQRQIGKVADLALGFGGSTSALDNMAANYGVVLPADQKESIVLGWRAARPAFERWWALLEYSALIALDTPGREVSMPVGRNMESRVVFVRDSRALRMTLPSGRTISYHDARLTVEHGASAPTAIYSKPEGYIETLDRKILSNNLTQGLARDLFWEIMCDVSRAEHIVHHVYDEIILEVPQARADERLAQLLERMSTAPQWAPGLPLAAAGYVSLRWKKD